jgi:hypothetical protein
MAEKGNEFLVMVDENLEYRSPILGLHSTFLRLLHTSKKRIQGGTTHRIQTL